MTDRELYNYIKDNYKPEKGTTLFFDVTSYDLAKIRPIIFTKGEDVERAINEIGARQGFFVTYFYTDEGLTFFFSGKEFTQDQNLTTGRTEYFCVEEEVDMEKVKEELSALASLLKSQAS